MAVTQIKTLHHVLGTDDFNRQLIETLTRKADEFRITPRLQLLQRLAGTVIATLFYEPSTRTRLSFESAATRLGAHVVGAENAQENSSAKKGESLEDVFRVVGSYVDAIVIRHHEIHEMAIAAGLSPVPIINAGAGAGEHPTQALLDVYSMHRELGRVDGLHICLVGDLKYGRTVHSLLRTLMYFNDIHVTLVHPDALGLPTHLEQTLQQAGVQMKRGLSLEQAVETADVVYQTRIQTERLTSAEEAKGADAYLFTLNHLKHLPKEACILHPLPRVNEIEIAVDSDIRAAYFRQAENGLYLRMALLDEILNEGGRLS